jgi:hypothetical protein
LQVASNKKRLQININTKAKMIKQVEIESSRQYK